MSAHVEAYPFAIIATVQKGSEPGAFQPPPIMIGPDAFFAQRNLEVK